MWRANGVGMAMWLACGCSGAPPHETTPATAAPVAVTPATTVSATTASAPTASVPAAPAAVARPPLPPCTPGAGFAALAPQGMLLAEAPLEDTGEVDTVQCKPREGDDACLARVRKDLAKRDPEARILEAKVRDVYSEKLNPPRRREVLVHLAPRKDAPPAFTVIIDAGGDVPATLRGVQARATEHGVDIREVVPQQDGAVRFVVTCPKLARPPE